MTAAAGSRVAWTSGTLAAMLALALPHPSHLSVALAVAGIPVLVLGVARSAAGDRLVSWTFAALAILAAAVAASLWTPFPAWGVALAIVAGQAALAALTPEGRAKPVSLAAHGAAVAASAAAILQGPGPASALLATGAFAILALQAHWTQARRRDLAGWDLVLLAAIVLACGATSLVYTAQVAQLEAVAAWEGPALQLALMLAAPVLAILCGPPAAWLALRRRRVVGVEVVAQGTAAIALLNILFLGFTLVSGWSLRLLLGILAAWQFMVILLEYRTVRHAERRRRQARFPPLERSEPITVIVPACDEAAVLPESLERNLAVDYPLRFLLVPAAKSKDGTVAVAHRLAAKHPGRVRVIEGTLGSKAAELNMAWETVDTRYVLLLDADETVERASLLHAVAVLERHPDVGVVQGRKVSRAPESGFLARLVSAERRYCTWMDHVMHSEDLGSSHFGGSAALVRREVPPQVGGWTDRTLTEDIEFTLRVHLDGKWRIVYLPEMVVRESDPATTGDLLKQRTRWARGWAQCLPIFLPQVLRQRKRLGARRTFGLALLLLIAVSALWTTFLPASLLMRLAGVSPLMPIVIAIPLSLILLPSRLLAYGYAAWRDPVIPVRMTPRRFAELAFHAYLWILLGWLVQLHALYLELSRAPRVWSVTGKRTVPTPVPAPTTA